MGHMNTNISIDILFQIKPQKNNSIQIHVTTKGSLNFPESCIWKFPWSDIILQAYLISLYQVSEN